MQIAEYNVLMATQTPTRPKELTRMHKLPNTIHKQTLNRYKYVCKYKEAKHVARHHSYAHAEL